MEYIIKLIDSNIINYIEVENFNKILNKDNPNNFDHNIVYSDDDTSIDENKSKVSFGNLNITVS